MPRCFYRERISYICLFDFWGCSFLWLWQPLPFFESFYFSVDDFDALYFARRLLTLLQKYAFLRPDKRLYYFTPRYAPRHLYVSIWRSISKSLLGFYALPYSQRYSSNAANNIERKILIMRISEVNIPSLVVARFIAIFHRARQRRLRWFITLIMKRCSFFMIRFASTMLYGAHEAACRGAFHILLMPPQTWKLVDWHIYGWRVDNGHFFSR